MQKDLSHYLLFRPDLDPPTDFKVVDHRDDTLTLRWQKPKAKVGGYRLQYVSRDGHVQETEIPADATSHVLPDLIPGMSYTMTLIAERGVKESTPVTLSTSTGGWL